MNHLSSYLNLLESIMSNHYFIHVTSSKNAPNIFAHGLQPNANGGNYSGYFESLDGVYLSKVPSVIKQHIYAREIQNDYLLVIVEASGKTYADEDVYDDIISSEFQKYLKKNGILEDDIDEDFDPDELIGEFVSKLGKPANHNYMDVVTEYVRDWVGERILGADVESWVDIKTKLVELFPDVVHPFHGKDYSVRVPHFIGYDGDTRIVGIVRVRNGMAKVVKGILPPEVKSLISNLSDINESAPPGKKAERFIKQNKKEFKDRYGDSWETVLYSTAWKKFGKSK